MESTINHATLDATGLACPLPLLKVKQWLASAGTGERLHVLASDPGSARDIPRYIRSTPHRLAHSIQHPGHWEAVIVAGPDTEVPV